MGMSGRTDPLLVCGPEGFSEALRSCLEVCEGEIGYPLEMRDVGPGDRVGVAGMTVEVFATEHGIASQGYVLRDGPARKIDTAKAESLGIKGDDFRRLENGEEVNGVRMEDICLPPVPGSSVAYTGDTKYLTSEESNAEAHNHSTAKQAAEVADEAGVGTLVLIHVSNRYKDLKPVLEEASAVFPNTVVPRDFEFYVTVKGGIRSA